MPTSVVVAAVAAVATETVAATVAAGALTIGFSVATFATTLALSAVSGLLNKKPQQGASQAALPEQVRGQTTVVRSSAEPRRVIYGQSMVSGPLIFAGATNVTADAQKTGTQTLTVSGGVATLSVSNLVAVTGVSFRFTVYSGSGNYVDSYKLNPVGTTPGRGQYLASGTTITVNANDVAQFGSTIVVTYTYTEGSNNVTNGFMHLVIALAGHEVQAINEIYLNDQLAVAANGTIQSAFSGYLDVYKYLGTTTQQADPNLIAAFPGTWTTAHKLQGIAYLYVRLKYDSTVYPTGLPNVKAVVQGKKVYDPRTGLTAYSNNWALCVRDYLTNDYGLNTPAAEIDDTSVIAAANTCDESVTITGGTQVRYTCDGVVSLNATPLDIMKRMLTAAAGTVVYTQGKYKVFAGAYSAPIATLTETDLRDKITVQPSLSMKDTYNAVRGTYINPAQYWQASDFPPVTNATYVTQDNGVQQFRDIELPFTQDPIRAQRIAKIYLEKSRQSITVQLPAKFTAFKVGIWDRVYLSLSSMGWSNKVFLVTGWRFANGGVDLVLQEDSSASYDWNMGNATAYDPAPNTNLPDPRYVAPPGAPTITESLYASNNAVNNRATLNWSASSDAFVRYYDIQYAPTGTSAWVSAPSTNATTQNIDNLPPGTFDFRVRAVSTLGRFSQWQQTTTQLYGKTAAPRDIQNLQLASLNDTTCQLSWTQSPDLDVQIGGFIRVRYSPLTVGASWTQATDIGPALPGIATNVVLPLQAGTYFVKAIDSSNNPSTNATSVVTDVPAVANTNVVATITESPTFPGAKSSVNVFDGTPAGLVLSGAVLIDSQTSNIDTWSSIDFNGGVVSTGTYSFQNTLDLGGVYASKLTATLGVTAFDVGDYIDNRTALIDFWNFIDGGVVDNVNAQLWVRTTNDNPGGTPTWSAWEPFFVGTYTARAFQFQLVLTSGANNQNIAVSSCVVTVDMPDRVEQGNSVVSSASVPTAVTYSLPFRATPAIGITANNLASGDYWVITGQSASGFNIIFRNSAGTQISRTFDWLAKGYGKQVA